MKTIEKLNFTLIFAFFHLLLIITIRLPLYEDEKIQRQFYPHENKHKSTNQRSNKILTTFEHQNSNGFLRLKKEGFFETKLQSVKMIK